MSNRRYQQWKYAYSNQYGVPQLECPFIKHVTHFIRLYFISIKKQPRTGTSQYITGDRMNVRCSIPSRGKQLHWDPHNSGSKKIRQHLCPKGKDCPRTTNCCTPHEKIAASIYRQHAEQKTIQLIATNACSYTN
jgi:hypothetical protein